MLKKCLNIGFQHISNVENRVESVKKVKFKLFTDEKTKYFNK